MNIVKRYWQGIDEKERATKAAVLGDRSDLEFIQQIVIRACLHTSNAHMLNESMIRHGWGAHWYSPRRLAMQVLVNRSWAFALDMVFIPEQTMKNIEDIRKSINKLRFKREMKRGIWPDRYDFKVPDLDIDWDEMRESLNDGLEKALGAVRRKLDDDRVRATVDRDDIDDILKRARDVAGDDRP